MSKRIIITGATGLLGRAVASNLRSVPDFDIQGWALSRADNNNKRVDIGNKEEIEKAVDDFKPNVIIHCAALRAPDIVDKQQELAKKINVSASEYLAECAARHGALMIYVSTDYVFDGEHPPYSENAQPNPLNNYGRQKLDGERVVLEKCPGAIILRVAILYGPVEYLGEGAVDVLLKALLNTNVPCKMSDYERRYPTHVEDVASVIRLLLENHFKNPGSVSGIFHWCGDEEMTKYDMSMAMANVFSLPIAHLIRDTEKPAAATCQRPYNSRLKCEKLSSLGAKNKYSFREGIEKACRKFVHL